MQVLKLKLNEYIPDNHTGIVKWGNGIKEWYKNGNLHREDGPAVEFSNGTKYWYIEGLLHRENGPAIEYFDKSKIWSIEGEEYHMYSLLSYFKYNIFLNREIGKYGLVWYKFLTKKGIEEIPFFPGMTIPSEE